MRGRLSDLQGVLRCCTIGLVWHHASRALLCASGEAIQASEPSWCRVGHSCHERSNHPTNDVFGIMGYHAFSVAQKTVNDIVKFIKTDFLFYSG
ncbi:hypothetical protein OBBRIDRAFT_139386 [Obba rivulosa]|uniref:Uncharacterized protein n=1 Tax=Obba rivulosa TaxID=1052685 RepID=A0A8E2ASP8_9APHY|nr:hypothetical protein OBBRIDRAFT_139386 [Obba rivulosa]